MKSRRMRHRGESGFAMLLVFVMAAVIAISLYYEMPRVGFESQRLREQQAIDRANEYKRAIQLFYRKYKTYPQNLDDLETTRNIRFLRRRYKDPLTGKDWRLVHVGPGGQLTDSAIKPANPAQTPGANGTTAAGAGASGAGGFGASGTAATATTAGTTPGAPQIDPQTGQPISPGLNMAVRRPSDRVIGGGPELPADPNQPQSLGQPQYPGQAQYPGQPQDPTQPQYPQYPAGNGQPQDPSQPQQPQYPGQPGYPIPAYPGQAGQPIPGQPGLPQIPGQPLPQDPSQPQPFNPQPVQYPGLPAQVPNAGQPGQYPVVQPGGFPAPVTAPPGMPSQPYGQQPFAGPPGVALGLPTPGGAQIPAGSGGPGAPGTNPAAGLIQQILTTPRQPPSSINTNAVSGGMTGIAGVGGAAEGKGIHVINDHSKYKEWEFIYDIKNDKTAIGAGAVLQQQLLQQQQQQNQQGAQPNSPFGSQPTSTAQPTSGSTAPIPTQPAIPPTSQ